MPRNVTVTLADGTQHVYANAPDDITPDAVTARALKDFGQPVKALDGGRNAAPAPTATAAPPTAQNAFGLGKPPGPKGTPARAAYDAEYNKRFNVAWLAAHPREAQLRQARSDPAFAAKLAAAETQRKAANAAQKSDLNAFDAAGSAQGGGFGTGYRGGFTRGTFGLGERIGAAAATYLPTWLGGVPGSATYDENLAKIRANTDAQMARSTTGNILGQLTSGTAVTAGAGAGIGAGASRLAASGAPVAARAGNVLQTLMTLRKGQRAANAGKLALMGATQGTAQAIGEGSDPIKGAEYGAAGALTLGAGFKAAQVLTRPFRDVLRLSNAGQILSRLTSASSDQLATRAQAYRDATGAEPTLFELLPLADRNKILKQAVVGKDNVVEAASTAIRNRANNLGPEMSARARAILTPNRDRIVTNMTQDLAQARGGQNLPGDAELAARAAESPTDMSEFRDQEARAIMAPHEQTPAANQFNELLPQAPQNINGTITMTDADPAVTAAIRSVAPGGFRNGNQGVTAGDISDMIQKLRGDLGRGGIEGRTAERAIAHLEDELQARAPDAAAAHAQMTDAYAARSRMMEGLQEGDATRLRDQVQTGTNRGKARTVRNAYDTPEGAAGRNLGQGNKILTDLGGSPDEALRATVGISRNSTGRQLAQNVGPDEAAGITAAARAQDESAQALAAASSKAQSSGEGGNAEVLVQALSGLHPGGFVTTKAHAIRKLIDMTYIPENRARTIVDMIFSQNPEITRRALNAVGNEKNGAAFQRYLAQTVGRLSGEQRGNNSSQLDTVDTSEPAVVPTADAAGAPETVPVPDEASAAPAPGEDPNVPYGHAVIKTLFPNAEITSDVRAPDDPLSEKNPGSYHTKSQNAVDVRPIPGMTFAQFIGEINDAGYSVIEARDEQTNPIPGLTTGPHWHVVVE